MINLKDKILYCLDNDQESRNSDIRLTQMVWHNYHSSKLFQDESGNTCVRIKDLFDLPREDHIKRIRASIQNDQHKFLPTRPEVRKQRRINEDLWHREMSPSNPSQG